MCQHESNGEGSSSQKQHIVEIINSTLDKKLESLATRLEKIISEKIEALETKFGNTEREIKEMKDDYNRSLNYVEESPCGEMAETWEYAI